MTTWFQNLASTFYGNARTDPHKIALLMSTLVFHHFVNSKTMKNTRNDKT